MSRAATPDRHVTAPDGVRLAVYEDGVPDGPLVVLVHGYPDTAAVWDLVVERLADSHRIVRYDVRGAGASDRPTGLAAYDLRVLSDDLVAVLDATADGRPAHLVGHDWGSIQSWESAARPDVARRLASFTALAGPSLDLVAGRMRRGASHGGPTLGRRLSQLASSWYVVAFHLPLLAPATWRLGGRFWGSVVARQEGRRLPAGHPAPTLVDDAVCGIRLYRRNFVRRLGRPRYDRVAVPDVQVLVTRHDAFITPEVYDGLEDAVERLRRIDLDAPHWAPLTRPDEVAGALAAFVTDVEAGAA